MPVSVLATVTVVAVVAVTSALFVIFKVCAQQIGVTPKLDQREQTEGLAFVHDVTKLFVAFETTPLAETFEEKTSALFDIA